MVCWHMSSGPTPSYGIECEECDRLFYNKPNGITLETKVTPAVTKPEDNKVYVLWVQFPAYLMPHFYGVFTSIELADKKFESVKLKYPLKNSCLVSRIDEVKLND